MTFMIGYDRNSEEEGRQYLDILRELGTGTRIAVRNSYANWCGPSVFKRAARKGMLSRLTLKSMPTEKSSVCSTLATESDRYIRAHNCGGMCKDGYGYWLSPYNFNIIMDACGSYKGILEREKQRKKDEERRAADIKKYSR